MKSVMISIQPKWCELIASGKKTVEVRKTRPKMQTPFKVYIYETQGRKYSFNVKADTIAKHDDDRFLDCVRGNPSIKKDKNGTPYFSYGRMKVIGEFVCDKITDARDMGGDEFYSKSCLTYEDWRSYTDGTKNTIWLWHISNLVIYDKPKELIEFRTLCKYRNEDGSCQYMKVECDCVKFNFNPDYSVNFAECMDYMYKPPQSWCYVEGEG